MTSKAWYKPSTLPQLVARFQQPASKPSQSHLPKKSIEVYTTTCIVTNFGMQRTRNKPQADEAQLPGCSTLINPANPFLTGPHSFPYFPMGGPQPAHQPNRTAHHIMGYVTQWGGMDVGSGMLFPAATIDGLVHQYGGKALQRECSQFPEHPSSSAYINQQSQTVLSQHQQVKCPVGSAVITSAGSNELRSEYDNIIHTVPPFYKYPPSMTQKIQQLLCMEEISLDEKSWSYELVLSCYRQSFELAFHRAKDNETRGLLDNILDMIGYRMQLSHSENCRVAVPLLGAGCRGFPTSVAIDAAAAASTTWLLDTYNKDTTDIVPIDNEDHVVAFGLLETSDAQALAAKIEELL